MTLASIFAGVGVDSSDSSQSGAASESTPLRAGVEVSTLTPTPGSAESTPEAESNRQIKTCSDTKLHCIMHPETVYAARLISGTNVFMYVPPS